MYCKNCNSLIENNESICPNCNYDNSNIVSNESELKEIIDVKKINNKNPLLPITIMFLFLFTGIVCIYIIKDTKASSNKTIPATTTEASIILNNEFVLSDISLKYPDSFGTSANTIFYKNNNDYNIVIKNINELEYNELINSNETLNSTLGNIDTLTFANDYTYSHIFSYKDMYYNITVNYIVKETLENTKIQLEMAKIINSLQEK